MNARGGGRGCGGYEKGHERETGTNECTGADTTRHFHEESFSITSFDSVLCALRLHEQRLASPVSLLGELVVGVHVEVIAKVDVGSLGHGRGGVDDALELHEGGRGGWGARRELHGDGLLVGGCGRS